ncbi:cytochrome P450 [Streptomyces sp. NPDC006430]|uniref:cytochrome P450 n=1 Tax=Streptomyces sp. NPDC006430 TaxID=3154299 RepID=UPI00339E1A0D
MLTLDTLDITDERQWSKSGYPYAEWDLLRREAPVFWYQRPGFEPFWVLTRHEDIATVSKDTAVFSSAQRITVDPPDAIDMLQGELELRAGMFGHSPDDSQALSDMDAPRHRHLRQIMAPCFTPKAIAELRERFDELAFTYVSELTGRLETHGEADVARHLAARLPVAAICELVGAPAADWDDIFEWTEGTIGAADPDYQREGESAEEAFRRNMTSLNGYIVQLVQSRMAQPTGTDIVSRLVQARIDGEAMQLHEILYATFNLLIAGVGTTRNSITDGIRALLANPDQLRMLVEDPSLTDRAVEEILRWSAVAPHFVRTCLQDTEIGGQLIRKGETVALWYPSANRDESVFEDPYRFDITREQNPHQSFGGHGPHICLGRHLARLELNAILRAVLPILPTLETVREPELTVQHLQATDYKRFIVRKRP